MKKLGALAASAAVVALLSAWTPTAAAQYGYPSAYDPLTGTYELDRPRGDDPQRIVDQAIRQLPAAERSAASARLVERLAPSEVLALERRGNRISLASSRVPEMTFEAGGQTRVERGLDGHRLTTTASLYGNRLELSARGSGGNDLSVTFEPLDNGSGLRVTRRLFDDQLRQPVVMESFYRKASPAPDWGGKGAAIGAVLGGGGAAATVYVDQLNQRTLPRGTEFRIRAR